MKKLILILIASLFLTIPVIAADTTLTLEWNYDEADFSLLTGFRLYSSTTAGTYDTALADILIGDLQPTGTGIVTSSRDVQLTIPDDAVTTMYFVTTAYNANGESDYSNEVSMIFDYENPPAVSDLSGIYNDQTQTIDFTWTYDPTWLDRVEYWGLYVGDSANGPFTTLASIPYDPAMTEPYTISQSVDVPAGQNATFYYVLVAHRSAANNSAFSANSNVVEVIIRKMPPNAPFELKVRIK